MNNANSPHRMLASNAAETSAAANASIADSRARRRDNAWRNYAVGDEAGDSDWSMLAAQAYQESAIDQSRRSAAGAVGVMQVLPSTAADKNVAIEDIDKIENNIHAGVKYLRFIADRYFKDENMDEFNKAIFFPCGHSNTRAT